MTEQGRARVPEVVPAQRERSVAPVAVARTTPDATVARLPLYLRALHALADSGAPTVSSQALAALVGGGSAQVRRDLSHLGSYGRRGVGYEVRELVLHIRRELGLTQGRAVVLVGVGNLGSALAGYGGFASRGFTVAALLDVDPGRVGEVVAGQRVRPVAELERAVAETGACTGVIATPAEAAQEVCDRLVAAGVTSILDFAPVVLRVPAGVDVRTVDLGAELEILSYHQSRRAADGAAAPRAAGLPQGAGQPPHSAVRSVPA